VKLAGVQPNPEVNVPGKHVAVRQMFAEIAPSYDRLNHLLSAHIDKYWRWFTVRKIRDLLLQPDALALDLCCGTGDLAFALAKFAKVVACDFCHPMLVIGRQKGSRYPDRQAQFTEGDALMLPFADGVFDVVTISFGLRNLENLEGGLREMLRVLKPGGRAAVLEFSQPVVPVFASIASFYMNRMVPRIGARLSGYGAAYHYLPASVRAFPKQRELMSIMQEAGFQRVRYHNLMGGAVALHLGESCRNRDERANIHVS
jgi:demethylmenaquinone methyltransferase / 2-methoxy-6-polyprenyl-1,4-benzoquinol methylase